MKSVNSDSNGKGEGQVGGRLPPRANKKHYDDFIYDEVDDEENEDDESHGGMRKSSSYATLGQLAEQVQAKARADLKARGIDDFGVEINEDIEDFEGVCATGEEHTGRWTKEEHNQFLEGLRKFGKV